MSLETLLSDAFQRGCGISRRAALGTPRYRDLLALSPRIPHTTQAETAEMMYLGERLADRAFRNLPRAFREKARQWSTLSENEQHATLKGLVITLRSPKWQHNNARTNRDTRVGSEALPAEYGSWTRGPARPNCLGIAQMLIGFARATGADHLMVDTVTQADYYHEQLYEQTCRAMIEKLTPYKEEPSIVRLISKLTKYHHKSLVSLAYAYDVRQAHHALAIRVGEDWVVVDPYMNTKYPIRPLRKTRVKLHTAITKAPWRRWWCQGGEYTEIDCLVALQALDLTLEYFARRSEAARELNFRTILNETAATISWRGIVYRKDKLPKDRINRVCHFLLMVSMLTPADAREEAASDDDELFSRRLHRMTHHKRERNAAMARLIKHVCHVALTTPYDAIDSKRAEHRRIELSHPALHLAVMTLNHLGVVTFQSTAQLLRFDQSQWLLHDTLKEVTNSGDRRLQRIAERALGRISKAPHLAMPQLLTEFNKRK